MVSPDKTVNPPNLDAGNLAAAVRARGWNDGRAISIRRNRAPATTVIRPRKRRLNVNHVHAGLNGRFSHPSVEGQDVSCSPRER